MYMPAFPASRLSDADVRAIADYIGTLALAKQVLKPRALLAFGLAAGFGLGRLLAAATPATGRYVGQHLLDVGAAACESGLTAPRTLHTPAHDSLLARQAENRRTESEPVAAKRIRADRPLRLVVAAPS